jgi:hypothetical protein
MLWIRLLVRVGKRANVVRMERITPIRPKKGIWGQLRGRVFLGFLIKMEF